MSYPMGPFLLLFQLLSCIFAFAFLLGWVIPLATCDCPEKEPRLLIKALESVLGMGGTLAFGGLVTMVLTRNGRSEVRRKWRETPSLRFCFRAFWVCALGIAATAWIPVT